MIEQGFLKPHDIENLKKELALDGFETLSAAAEPKSISAPQSQERIALFGRYIQLEFLGQGGMARVYKAYDPSLRRTVALKMVKVDDSQLAHRLLIEARAQARIEHEHVCKIYEAGEVDGKPYIAMQYINGKTLKDRIDSLPLKQKVELIRQVADGVHAAHKAGLIHRDLKPTNILIEQRETGPVAYVMDFGLAHESQVPSFSISGLIVGTPSYMSPEQARGEREKLNAASDIYSVGATLYEIITRQPPFNGTSSTEILMKVLEQEPIAPRKIDPNLPADLQTIVLKCLEKDPQRRYRTARMLSEDLSRFLDDEPIKAKQTTWIYRLTKRVKKHPIVSGLVVVAILAVIVFAAIAGIVQWRAKEQAELFQEFGQEVTRIEAIMRYAYLLPLHDVQQEKQQVLNRLNQIKERMNTLGSMAYGPGHYSLGRGYLSLHRYQDACDHLTQAWEKYNYREPAVANALGLSLAELFQEKLRSAEQTFAGEELKQQKELLIKKYRDPALKYIRHGVSVSEAPEYVEALLAYLGKHYPDAIKKTNAAVTKVTWLYEAMMLQGNIYTSLGNDQREAGQTSSASDSYEKAKTAYQNAATKGQSDPEIYEGLCALHASILRMHLTHSGTLPQKIIDEGLAYCDMTYKADSKNINSFMIASDIYTDQSFHQRAHGLDDSIATDKAVQYAHSAHRIEPENAQVYAALGKAVGNRADSELDHGRNPIPFLDEADANYKKALEKMPSNHHLMYNLGQSLMQRARYEYSTGKNATQSFDKALHWLKKSVEINPRNAMYLNQLCLTYFYKSQFEIRFGLDPRDSLKNAIAVSKKSTEVNPQFVNNYIMTAASYINLADAQIERSANAIESLDQAILHYQKSLTLDPLNTYSFAGLGIAYWKKGLCLHQEKKDPIPMLQYARDALRRSININNKIMETYAVLAEVELLAARDAMDHQKDPEPFFNEARNVLNQGLLIQSDSYECLGSMAFLHLLRAEHLRSLNKNIHNEIDAGIETADFSLKQNPQNAELYAYRGKLFLLRAGTLSGENRIKAAQEAMASLSQAFQIKQFLKKDYQSFWLEAERIVKP